MKIYLNGKLVEKDDAKISVFDHGLLYGDGVFEGIRAYNGRVFRLEEHLKRLFYSAKAIMLEIPIKIEEMQEAVLETLRANNLRDAYIRLIITRGTGDLGLDPKKCSGPKCSGPAIIIIADKITLYPKELYTKGLEIATVSTRKNIPQAINSCIKSLNYLNNILAKIEATRLGVQEAIMLNAQGYVAECTGDNIFIIKKDKLITPPASAGALEGVTRGAVIELAPKVKLKVSEELFTPYTIYTADECFLTGTGAEVIPVVKFDGRLIGDGNPGIYSLKLIELFRELANSTGVAI
ncbi:MAG: branched-chain-amino-acid transaminase [Elusimicrobia bacterium]|nr:branched-chain-amino-acid transaminase [Candidatus Liberimonas magnetica]